MTKEVTLEVELGAAWDTYLSAICANMRQLGLLLNDLSIAAPMIEGEIHKADLIKIVAIQRFNPELHHAIYKNAAFVTYEESWLKNPIYVKEDIKKERDQLGREAIEQAIRNSSDPAAYRALMTSLFPVLTEKLADEPNKNRLERYHTDERIVAQQEKRVAHPDYFPIYFRYQIPESIIGSKYFASIIKTLSDATTEEQCYVYLENLLSGLGRGSLRRYDFLEKLSEQTLDETPSSRTCRALSRLSDRFQYDMMDIGEAALALNFIANVANRMAGDAQDHFLRDTLLAASDDTFALRILERSLPKKDGVPSNIRLASSQVDLLKVAFTRKMRRKYAQKTSARTVNLETVDPRAFWRWAAFCPHDVALIRKFWRSYISQDLGRLTWAINSFFVRFAWSESPAPLANNLFSDRYLRHAVANFHKPDDYEMPEFQQGLRWMTSYLANEFSGGVSPFWNHSNSPN